MSDCPCCEPPWSFLHKMFTPSPSSSPSSSPSGVDIIEDPTPCLIALAEAINRTDPWPYTLYAEDDYGHVLELQWDGTQWTPPFDIASQPWQGTIRTCTGNVYAKGTNPSFPAAASVSVGCLDAIFGGPGLRFGTLVFYLAPANFLSFNNVPDFTVSGGYQLDPIDISAACTAQVKSGGSFSSCVCNPSGTCVSGAFTNFRLYE